MTALNGWLWVGSLEHIPPLGARIVRVADDTIAVFRTADDQLYALSDRCPHRGGPLSQGIVFGHQVACPLHDWVIDLPSGCAMGPDEGCTHTYALKVEKGEVFVALPRTPVAPEGAKVWRPQAEG